MLWRPHVSMIAERCFNFRRGIARCRIRFGSDTELWFRLAGCAAGSGSWIISSDVNAPHPAFACNGLSVPHRATLTGRGTSAIPWVLVTVVGSPCSASPSTTRLCCALFRNICTVMTTIATSRAPPTPIPMPRYAPGPIVDVLAAPSTASEPDCPCPSDPAAARRSSSPVRLQIRCERRAAHGDPGAIWIVKPQSLGQRCSSGPLNPDMLRIG